MSDWHRQPSETGADWLARLSREEAAGLAARELYIFGVHFWQASALAAHELAQAQGLPPPTPHQDSEAAADHTAVALVKGAVRLLSPEGRQQLTLWVKAGCPDEPAS
jgi:hypothetical protein